MEHVLNTFDDKSHASVPLSYKNDKRQPFRKCHYNS